jgi:LDH2 family malate/lactate/ureidoglycolate dehydrogenase
VTDVPLYRLDDLRRFATGLLSGSGVAPARASSLATHLLWFDAAGASAFGVATLADWLDRIADGRVDAMAEGRVASERLGTAVFDGQNGLPPLILSRAGELAVEKARDAGVGLVRVHDVGPTGPAAGVAAEMAIGPVVAVVQGPGPSWSLALPSDEGLPAVFDSVMAEAAPRPKGAGRASKAPAPPPVLPWASALVPDGGWLVAAIGLPALEPLSTFQERVGDAMRDQLGGPGRFPPIAWEAHRRAAREHGVEVASSSWKKLRRWADRLGVDPPGPANC